MNKIPEILVIGDLMLDHYLWGKCDRISPEAPVQVVDVQKEGVVLGGAGNVINNLKALNINVKVASVVGEDATKTELFDHLNALEVDVSHIVTQANRKSSKKSRIIANNQQVMRYDIESTQEISSISANALYQEICDAIQGVSVVVLSDYGKGVLTKELTPRIIALANRYEIPILVDPKGKDYSKYKNATLITPNKKEASLAVGFTINSHEALKEAGQLLKKNYKLKNALITLSEEGMALFDASGMHILPTVAQEVFDVTGAGDTVIATIAQQLAHNKSLIDAAQYANAAAAVVVGKLGSATATHIEIQHYLSTLERTNSAANIKSFEEIANIIRVHEDKSIVFTNGCFDILHKGHVAYLEEAKSYGDILVVGVNSDMSVRRLKGDTRPINPQEDRAYILASLQAVDFVVIFDEDTPLKLIKIVQPDILVKGADYENKEVVGSDIAKEVRLVSFIEGKSTTQTIKKIQEEGLC